MERFERRKLIECLVNVLRSNKLTPRVFSDVCEWFADYGQFLELGSISPEIMTLVESDGDHYGRARRYTSKDITFFRRSMLPSLSKELRALGKARLSNLERNLLTLQTELELSECEKEVLGLKARYGVSKLIEKLVECIRSPGEREAALFSILLGESLENISKVYNRKARPIQTGLLTFEQEIFSSRVNLELPKQVFHALLNSRGGFKNFRAAILGETATTELLWEDFDHLGETREKVATFLTAACRKKCAGVNILLFGEPGNGKTEFAKTLAHHLNKSLYFVAEADEDGNEPSCNDRIASLRLTQSLLREDQFSIVLFDELDDMFESSVASLLSGRPQAQHKAFTLRLFEKNPVPVIYTVNDKAMIDASIVSRMSVVVELKTPPLSARKRVWERVLKKHKVKLSQKEIVSLARQERVPARIIQSAVRFAKLTGGNLAKDISFVVDNMAKAIHGESAYATDYRVGDGFLPELVNTDVDLSELVARLSGGSCHYRFSACLYGRSGTGKSAWARYLAKQIGMEVLYKRASGLLDMYVGNSEKNIAGMFQQAREEERLLIIDEADSLLADRSGAHRSWEVSQVNEMLTWMEDHPLPFICTTNLMETLDQASLRRFTFKIKFDYLSACQNMAAFQHFFKQPGPAALLHMGRLSPGDFAVVANKAGLLGFLDKPERLVEMLVQEVTARQDKAVSLGFIV